MSSINLNRLFKQKNFQDFCHFPNIILSSIGCDIRRQPLPMRKIIFKRSHFFLAVMSNLYVFTFIAKAMFTMMTSDEFELALLLRILSGFNYTLFGTIKCFVFVWKRNDYGEIFDSLEQIYPKTRKENLNYKVGIYYWPKWILRIFYFYLGAAAFIVVSPLMEAIALYIWNLIKNGWGQTEFRYYKLYEIEYSFDHRSFVAYVVTYFIEVMHSQFIITFNICSDLWLLCFTLQLCMHFDDIAQTLENYEPNERDIIKDQEFIAKLVKRHQIILNIGDDLNKSFGLLLLLLLISIATTLCCAGVYTFTQGLGRELIEYMAFLPTAIGQYFLVCYYGHLLILRSQGVAEAAYNNSWYNGSHSYKKSIFIIMMRSQKEVALNALGFQPICLEAFQMVMGHTYRVFALLKETML